MNTMSNGALHTGGYGAAELSGDYPRFMSQSLLLSIALQVALIATFDVFREPERTAVRPDGRPPVSSPGPIRIPVVLTGGVPVRGPVSVRNAAGLKFAIPVPVPVENRDTLSPGITSLFEGTGQDNGDGTAGETTWMGGNTPQWEDIPEPTVFIPFEQAPVVVKRVEANYPPLAVRSGVEGTVTVRVFVSKSGRIRKAIVAASSAEILDDAAVKAASQWVFTPALMNKNPVAVWVSIPFRFRLQ